MSNFNIMTSDRTLLPVMLEITGLIGSFIGIFLSIYYIERRGIDFALDVGSFWLVESITLPYAITGFFFEDSLGSSKKNPLLTQQASIVFFSFSLTMFFLHYGKFCKDSKAALTVCLIQYLTMTAAISLQTMIKRRQATLFQIAHCSFIFSILIYVCYFAYRFMI